MYLLVSETPVAGTVARIATWMSYLTGVLTVPLVRRNYAHNALPLDYGAFGALPNWQGFVASQVEKSDAIFVHNVFNTELLDVVFSHKRPTASAFYQYHSPPFEPPAFFYDVLQAYPFDHVFAVAQGYARFLRGVTPVPNIVPDFRLGITVPKNDVFLIPHMRSTDFRWSKKLSNDDMIYLTQHSKTFGQYTLSTIKELFRRDFVTYGELMFFLHSCTGVIDDVNTGLFHQTSVEGLKAGCAVFCGADLVSQEEFCRAADAEPLPFVPASSVKDVVEFMQSRQRDIELKKYMSEAAAYSSKFLGEEILAKRYLACIKSFLN